MVQTDDAVVVGCMALRVVSEHRRGELGYWVGHAFRGHGYATEAAARLIAFGFDDLALNRIEAAAIPSNRASTRVLEKCGLKYEGTLRQQIFHWVAFHDVDQFGLLREDYMAIYPTNQLLDSAIT